MELRQIRYVLEIAKYNSFSRAAEMLFISQPAISQQVRALEQELHTTLFQRDTRRRALLRRGRADFRAGRPSALAIRCRAAAPAAAEPRRIRALPPLWAVSRRPAS